MVQSRSTAMIVNVKIFGTGLYKDDVGVVKFKADTGIPNLKLIVAQTT